MTYGNESNQASTIDAITDAGAFYVGRSETYHAVSARTYRDNPSNGPRTLRVGAPCGAWGDASEGRHDDTRPAQWASGYRGVACHHCKSLVGLY